MVKDAPKERKSEIKKGIRSNKDKTNINISFWSWIKIERAKMEKGEVKRKEEEEEEEEKRKEERRKGKRRSQVWNAMILYRKYRYMVWNPLFCVWFGFGNS